MWALVIVGIMSCPTAFAVTNWGAAVTPANSVVNDDVNITAAAVTFGTAGGRVSITVNDASTRTVTITAGADVTFTANDLAGAGNDTVFDLITTPGSTIVFNLPYTLDLVGNNHPLLITHSGGGEVRFNIAGNERLGLINAWYIEDMTSAAASYSTTFARLADDDNDAAVYVGASSIVGFVGTDTTFATESSAIAFEGSNALGNTGRLALQIADTGAYMTQGHLLTVAGMPFVYTDIDFTALAGASAYTVVTSRGTPAPAGDWSSLLVINRNNTMSLIRHNPWMTAAPVVGVQYGFFVGSNGVLQTNDQTYFDYIGAQPNVTVIPVIPGAILERFNVNGVIPAVTSLVKMRNPSACMFDDANQLQFGTPTYPRPTMIMLGTSKLYFRSIVDIDGASAAANYTVDPERQYVREDGFGSIVFDVEGSCTTIGAASTTNAINLLSIYEADQGGSAFITGSETNFKLRTYARDGNNIYLQYGKGCFMINGLWSLLDVALQHTDDIHRVYEHNYPQESETCYVGGETYVLDPTQFRPTIAFYNSRFLAHTSFAYTGVDFLTPSYMTGAGVASANNSYFIFHHNGWVIDSGTGRNGICGSNVGATAADGGTIIDNGNGNCGHFDSRQLFAHATATISMSVLTAPNNAKVVENCPSSGIDAQYSNHSLCLAHGTNLSLGTFAAQGTDPDGSTFAITSRGTVGINGDFISIDSLGGYSGDPKLSVEIGQGGIFVDNGGRFEVGSSYRAKINAMLGTSYGDQTLYPNSYSQVSIPSTAVIFGDGVGITPSNLDMSVANQRVIVAAGSTYTDFSYNAKYVTYDPSYVRFVLPNTPAPGDIPLPTAASITTLPRIEGTVKEFQMQNSRFGDPASIWVHGGTIREFLFLRTGETGEASVANIVLDSDARVGLGTANLSYESFAGAMVLGINGVTLIPDGDAEVMLNQDVLIDNVCHIVPGPNFGSSVVNKLVISSSVPREIRVKRGGTLDFSLFNTVNKQLVLAGQTRLVIEPGGRVLGNGGVLNVIDDAGIILQIPAGDSLPVGAALTDYDDWRVKFNGTFDLILQENSFMQIHRGTILSIENGGNAIGGGTPLQLTTDITFKLEDAANIQLGTLSDYGGGLEVGNSTDMGGGSVAFTLELAGTEASFEMDSQAFAGWGVGLVNKPETAPNTWLVQPKYNVTAITFNMTEGTFRHNQIYTGSHQYASLMAFAAVSTGFNFNMAAPADMEILGGGNVAVVSGTTPVAPTVLTTDSSTAGIMASKATMLDQSHPQPANPATVAQIFTWFKANPYVDAAAANPQIGKHGQIMRDTLGTLIMGYVNGTTIYRTPITAIRGTSGSFADPDRSLSVGFVGMALTDAGRVTAYEVAAD